MSVFFAGGVGKSSLVLRFIKGTFRESYIPTIEDTYRQVSFDRHFNDLTMYHVQAHCYVWKFSERNLWQISWTVKTVWCHLLNWFWWRSTVARSLSSSHHHHLEFHEHIRDPFRQRKKKQVTRQINGYQTHASYAAAHARSRQSNGNLFKNSLLDGKIMT